MKILLILSSLLILVACKQPALEKMHSKAKIEKKVCYTVLIPYEIAGFYCLEYKDSELHKGL